MSEIYVLEKNPNDPGSYESAISVDFDSHEDFGVMSLSVPLSTFKRLVKSKSRLLKIESAEIGALLRSIVKNESESAEEHKRSPASPQHPREMWSRLE